MFKTLYNPTTDPSVYNSIHLFRNVFFIVFDFILQYVFENEIWKIGKLDVNKIVWFYFKQKSVTRTTFGIPNDSLTLDRWFTGGRWNVPNVIKGKISTPNHSVVHQDCRKWGHCVLERRICLNWNKTIS